MAKNDDWTDQEIEELLELQAAGKLLPQIAARLGKTPQAVYGKIRRLKKQPYVPASAPEAVQLTPAPAPGPLAGQKPVPFHELASRQCRAIVIDVGPDGLAMFCGAPLASGSPWCEQHRLIFTKQPESKNG